MKYQNLEAFKKHLKASFPQKLSNLYFVVAKDAFERSKIIDNITCYLPKNNALAISGYTADTTPVRDVIITLDSPSLLGGIPIVVIDGIDLYKRKDIQDLISYLKQNRLKSFLVLAAKEKKALLTLFAEVDKRGVILDLSVEKPWEKEKRLLNFIIEKCAQSKKSISKEAQDILLSFIGLDMSSLENEIDKVTLYVGEKHIVEKEDILAICSSINTGSFWQIAEKIIWEDPFLIKNIEKDYLIDNSFFYSLVIAFRYHLQEGLKISSLLENNLDIFNFFSNIRPNILLKRKEKAQILGSRYFKEGLKELFKIDMLSRTGMNTSFLFLIDLFRAKLTYFKNYETIKADSSS